MQTIAAVIPARNEEKNIEKCINSLKWCDRIVVLWMGDDRTGEIAKKLGAEVVKMNKLSESEGKSTKNDFIAVQKNINWAIDHCQTDWMLRVDTDEIVTPELKNEIASLLHGSITNNATMKQCNNETIVAFGIPRKQYFLDGFLKGGDWAYDRLVRLFKPQYARYDPIVSIHEQFKVNGKIGYLKNVLLHYSHMSLDDLKNKFQSYTDIQINDLHDSIMKTIFNMITQPPYIFIRWMIWHKGFIDGIRGIKAAYYRSWYQFILYKKYILKLLIK